MLPAGRRGSARGVEGRVWGPTSDVRVSCTRDLPLASQRVDVLGVVYPSTAKYWQIIQNSRQSDHFWTCTWSNVKALFRSGLPNITGATVRDPSDDALAVWRPP